MRTGEKDKGAVSILHHLLSFPQMLGTVKGTGDTVSKTDKNPASGSLYSSRGIQTINIPTKSAGHQWCGGKQGRIREQRNAGRVGIGFLDTWPEKATLRRGCWSRDLKK